MYIVAWVLEIKAAQVSLNMLRITPPNVLHQSVL